MKHNLSLAVILLGLFALPAFSQEYYKAGTIYLQTGDTLNGFISNQRTARFVKFKQEDRQVHEFTPDQLKGFVYEENIFISRLITREEKKGHSEEKIFMQLLVRGKAALYYYKEKDLGEHYWVEKDAQLYELKIIHRTKEIRGKQYLQEDKHYVGILKYVFSDCDKPEMAESNYTKSGLMAAVYRYNQCINNKEAEVVYKKSKIAVHPGIKVKLSHFPSRYNSKLQPSFSKSFGAFVNLSHFGANRVLSSQFEVLYSSATETQGNETYRNRIVEVAGLLRLTYPEGVVRPFFETGIIYTNDHTETSQNNAQYIVTRQMWFFKSPIVAGLHIPLKKQFLNVSAGAEKLFGIDDSPFVFAASVGFGF